MSEPTRPSCSTRIYGDRVQSWICSRVGIVERNGKWFCKQHDPESVAGKRAVKDAARRAKAAADESIIAEASRLAAALGVKGNADWTRWATPSLSGPTRNLVMSFEDAEKLAADRERLRRLEALVDEEMVCRCPYFQNGACLTCRMRALLRGEA